MSEEIQELLILSLVLPLSIFAGVGVFLLAFVWTIRLFYGCV